MGRASGATWRKRFAVWRSRLYFYPPAEAMPRTRVFWLATGVVALLTCLYAGYFIAYLTSAQAAYLTNAEDMGIMDQAIWNTLHGNMLHMTICNIVRDSNCYSLNGISRFAIHFEPILFPISLLYLPWPNPDTLLVLQSLVVAAGAFPAFWLARLRLRNEWAAVGIAALYLLYPGQLNAQVSDFHAVTFTSALLLFTLYFLYTRRTVWLFVFAILAMACKEEIPLVIVMFGLWSILFQHRWRSGLVLTLLAIIWAVVGLSIIPRIYSPVGHPLLTTRYHGLNQGYVHYALHLFAHPVSDLKQYVLQHDHFQYLRLLLQPAGYLPLLAPWILILALPSLAINLLSSDPTMITGLFQYNAEIVPILIFSTIEAIVLLIWLAQWLVKWRRKGHEDARGAETVGTVQSLTGEPFARDAIVVNRWLHRGLLALLLTYVLCNVVAIDRTDNFLPFGQGFSWPRVSAHDALASHLIAIIPADASVSAQSKLVPHLSQRATIYMFPYGDEVASYIVLDVTSSYYPYFEKTCLLLEIKHVLSQGNYSILAAQNGFLLLKRGLSPPGASTYAQRQMAAIMNELATLNAPNPPCPF